MKLTPKNWKEFQHYKNRRPPWIKLYRTLLDDVDFNCLPDSSKVLAIMLWLLASESEYGLINSEYKDLAFRLRTTPKKIKDDLKPLIDEGFFVASTSLSSCLHDAIPETETEGEIETEKTLSSSDDDTSSKVTLSNGMQKHLQSAIELLTFLNERTGRNFKPLRANLELIAGRLKEGATIPDCKAVIIRKTKEWSGTDMDQYLRPATLFNRSKFAQYSGEQAK